MPPSTRAAAAEAPRLLTRGQFRALTALGGLALALTGVNGALAASNRAAEREVAARGAFVQQTVPLEALQAEIARGLADRALRTNDRAVLEMLAANNVTVTPPAAPAPPTPARP